MIDFVMVALVLLFQKVLFGLPILFARLKLYFRTVDVGWAYLDISKVVHVIKGVEKLFDYVMGKVLVRGTVKVAVDNKDDTSLCNVVSS